MTLLVAWAAVDQEGASALYIGSDSRITWPSAGDRWDGARKTFAAHSTADIMGYCGDVLFTTQLLSQAVGLIDAGALFSSATGSSERHEALSNAIRAGFESYPASRALPGFGVLHCSRDSAGFHCFETSYAAGVWTEREHSISNRSGVVAKLGTGVGAFTDRMFEVSKAGLGDTSRGVFIALHDSIRDATDVTVGGPVQVVALERGANGLVRGIGTPESKSAMGMDASLFRTPDSIKWHNSEVERVDFGDLARLPGAQRQPRPKELR